MDSLRESLQWKEECWVPAGPAVPVLALLPPSFVVTARWSSCSYCLSASQSWLWRCNGISNCCENGFSDYDCGGATPGYLLPRTSCARHAAGASNLGCMAAIAGSPKSDKVFPLARSVLSLAVAATGAGFKGGGVKRHGINRATARNARRQIYLLTKA